GGRSLKDKWILQAELFNELYRWVRADWKKIKQATHRYREAEKYYEIVRDFLKAAQRVWGDTWANDGYMATKPVTLKALIRVCADLAREDAEPVDGRNKGWEERLAVWVDQRKRSKSKASTSAFPRRARSSASR